MTADGDGMQVTDELTEAAERRFLQRWVEGPQVRTWSAMPPQLGDKAPDFVLPDHMGTPMRLSEAWSLRPALVIFWRHWGCGCGTDRAERLRSEYADYVDEGLNVVIVGQGEPARAAAYRAGPRTGTRHPV